MDTKMKTLKDAIKSRGVAVQQLQVYKELKTFLEQFLSRDGVPTANAIQIENSRDVVEEHVIETINLDVEKHITDLEKTIEKLDTLKVQ